MKLKQLFTIQKIVEEEIKDMTNIEENALGEENIFDLRFLAFQVKVGELANTTKCYKYLEMSPNIPKEKLIFRYIDAFKFLLSIGNAHNFNIIDEDAISPIEHDDNIIQSFSLVYSEIETLKKLLRNDDFINGLSSYLRLFALYLNVGKILGLTFDEVFDYYNDKYKIYLKRKHN